jgi:hypothetical protein
MRAFDAARGKVADMGTSAGPFKGTHHATYADENGEPQFHIVMVAGPHAFTREEWDGGRSASIVYDTSRSQWCYRGGYSPVMMMTPTTTYHDVEIPARSWHDKS